jgi:hypothetical protein
MSGFLTPFRLLAVAGARVRRFVDRRRTEAVRSWHRLVLGWRRRSLPTPVEGRFLVTGPMGTGKSEVHALLAATGFSAVDADTAWGYFGDKETGDPTDFPEVVSHGWYGSHGWLWPHEAVHELLADTDRPLLFVCGRADNEAEFYRLFDRIFVLHATTETLLRRLTRRPPYCPTRRPVALQLLEEWNRRSPAVPHDGRFVAVDAEQPITRVVCTILREAANRGARYGSA